MPTQSGMRMDQRVVSGVVSRAEFPPGGDLVHPKVMTLGHDG